MNFKQSIVGDSIKYDDKTTNLKVIMSSKGKKRLVIGYLEILTGGRGNTLKKAIGIKVEQTCTNEINQSQWSSFVCT